MRSLIVKLASIALILAASIPAAPPSTASAQPSAAAAPSFSVQRGFFTGAFNLELSSPGASIRYTTDGSTPTSSSGTVYGGPIAIATTTSVRAIAYSASSAPSPVVTHSYIFLAGVRSQSDTPLPGWPNSFAPTDLSGVYPADYEMDAEVIGHANNAAKFDAVLKALPTLSLVTDLPNLWSPATGIYYRSNNKGNTPPDPMSNAWERATSIEWINPDGTTGFSQLAGLSIEGDTSRRPHRQPKKEFRISFHGAYGTSKLDFEPFDVNDPAAVVDQLILRNGGSRSWSYFDRDQRRESDYINDEWARRAWGQMGNLETHGTYVHLYLNGLYWGLYNVTERVDGSFLQSYLGLTAADYDVIQTSDDASNSPIATAGTVTAWNDLIALVSGTASVSDTLYQDVASKVDVVNLADYMIHAHAIGKSDPFHNWNAYRAITGADTRFKFTPLNNDTGLNKVTDNTTLVTDTVGRADAPVQVFQRLLTNAEFRQVVTDRLFKHVADPAGAFASTNCAALYSQLAGIVDQAVIGESARWGDYSRDKSQIYSSAAPKAFPAYLYSRDLPALYADPTNAVVDTDQKTWAQVTSEKLTGYCPTRATNVVNQYTANGWYQTVVKAPSFSQRGGMVAGGSISISNAPNGNAGTIYYTTNGVDPRLTFGAVAPGVTNGGTSSANVNISQITTVKARVLNGATWSPLAEYTFYPAQNFVNLLINEIHYNPLASAGQGSNDFEFIELHNRGGSALRLDDVSFKRGIYFHFPANTTLGAGQYLVLASDAASFQSRYGFAAFGDYHGTLSNHGEALELVDPAGATIDSVAYQNVAPWAFGADGGGGSLSLSSPTANNEDAASWFASVVNGGTPRAANSSAPAGKTVPQISWATPAPTTYGAPLGSAQLNAAVTSNGQPVPGTFSYSPAPGTLLPVGSGHILRVIFTPDDADEYAAVNAAVLHNVDKAPLTITADNKVKQVGAANPELTATYSGFVNGDTVAALTTPAALSTTATASSPVGVYPITVSGAAAANYVITFVEGALTVTDKDIPELNWTPAPLTYGTPLGDAQLNATATHNGQAVPGTFSYTPEAGSVLNAGNGQTLSVTFTPADSATYIGVSLTVPINVAKAPLTITAANKAKQVGTANPVLTASYSGFVNGDDASDLDTPVLLSTSATTDSPVGVYPITVTGATAKNYSITFVNGSLTVSAGPVAQYQALLPLVIKD